jgi:hypothetical protein
VARRDLVAASRQLPKELFGETRGQPYRKKALPSESGQGQDRPCCKTGGCATIRMSRANLPTRVIVPRAKLERIEGKCRDAAANTVAKYQTVKLLPPLLQLLWMKTHSCRSSSRPHWIPIAGVPRAQDHPEPKSRRAEIRGAPKFPDNAIGYGSTGSEYRRRACPYPPFPEIAGTTRPLNLADHRPWNPTNQRILIR